MDPDTQLLYQLLAEVQLERFFLKIRDELNVTRIEHLDYVKDTDLEQIGIRKPGFYLPCSVFLLKHYFHKQFEDCFEKILKLHLHSHF